MNKLRNKLGTYFTLITIILKKQPNPPKLEQKCVAISLQAAITNQNHMGTFFVPHSQEECSFLPLHPIACCLDLNLLCISYTVDLLKSLLPPPDTDSCKEGTLSSAVFWPAILKMCGRPQHRPVHSYPEPAWLIHLYICTLTTHSHSKADS